ncbi:hypothetical protein K7X08_023372 [Anisodus acutangulus]|uniref:Uncharacterized protein n=1 Tax=Anisodus acutangulus TaxID=402998 RepID=A0A9Q1R2M2_9SOLA|nr:hypothetical protein K7X08_023372 [Anisodus acutangulus]
MFKEVADAIILWSGLQVQPGQLVLGRTKGKHWPQFKKEVLAAIWSAMIYHTWRARNWRLFRGIIAHKLPKDFDQSGACHVSCLARKHLGVGKIPAAL